jgi:hypothetical protein
MIGNKKIHSLLLVLAVSTATYANVEVTGKIVNETASYQSNGTNIGARASHNEDTFKSATEARIYVDGDMNSSTYHFELQGFSDSENSLSDYNKNEDYTQRDMLREAYIDTNVELPYAGDISFRLGKQQVVWGTADGMKLLDMINPTDYSEMAQNSMEDSRIPVWMLNAEKTFDDGGNFQFIISQPKENIFAGLNRNIDTSVRDNLTPVGTSYVAASAIGGNLDVSLGNNSPANDQGHPFMMKGVDSIVGYRNGFLNLVPDIGSVAQRFANEFDKTGAGSLAGFTHTSVGAFAQYSPGFIAANFSNSYSIIQANASLGYDGSGILYGFGGSYDTNLMDATHSSQYGWGKPGGADSAFEYMANTSFATFDAFSGAKSRYVYNMPEGVDVAMRYKNSTEDGSNYSINYSYSYDKNPIIDLSWRNSDGEKLFVDRNLDPAYGQLTYLTLSDSRGNRYGSYADGSSMGEATLYFEEQQARIHNLGASYDTTLETSFIGPMVLRAEALYQKDTRSPVIDLTALSIGDLTSALTMVKGDRFKYVLGADITALTNMMVSFQFIEDRNLDFVDTTSTINSTTGDKYTTDYATMHMTNGFNKAAENKNFYSLYLSKPYGASGQHRWNNITMYESGGGVWNKLDTEYTYNDNVVFTAEWNNYGGDGNTQFGQLDHASNYQLGVKYSF